MQSVNRQPSLQQRIPKRQSELVDKQHHGSAFKHQPKQCERRSKRRRIEPDNLPNRTELSSRQPRNRHDSHRRSRQPGALLHQAAQPQICQRYHRA